MKKLYLVAFISYMLMNQVIQAKVSDTIRVACVGNSITYGYTLSAPAQESWPAQLGAMLGPGYDVRITV